jgi:hypothetical protein
MGSSHTMSAEQWFCTITSALAVTTMVFSLAEGPSNRSRAILAWISLFSFGLFFGGVFMWFLTI